MFHVREVDCPEKRYYVDISDSKRRRYDIEIEYLSCRPDLPIGLVSWPKFDFEFRVSILPSSAF